MNPVGGIHHVTAICGDAQENLGFYAGTLGLRLVKRSVNQDDPRRYHLFYAEAEGRPGTDLTFFPWPGGRQGRQGAGLTTEVAFAVPPGTLEAWQDRLAAAGVETDGPEERFGEPALTFQDPHGLPLALIESPRALERPFTPWERSEVPEGEQIRGLHAVRILEHEGPPTEQVITEHLGMEAVAEADGWTRFQGELAWSGYLDLRVDPEAPRGSGGLGTVHHVAWRVEDEDHQRSIRQAAAQAGLDPTDPIDRFWFASVYFREPGGVLFELATEEPGFTADEPLANLGERLVLPPWMEAARERIEANLPPLKLPYETKEA